MPSAVIERFYYEKATKSLIVVFNSGLVYRYKDVPEEIYIQMQQAFSKGTFLNTYIKRSYDFEKIHS